MVRWVVHHEFNLRNIGYYLLRGDVSVDIEVRVLISWVVDSRVLTVYCLINADYSFIERRCFGDLLSH